MPDAVDIAFLNGASKKFLTPANLAVWIHSCLGLTFFQKEFVIFHSFIYICMFVCKISYEVKKFLKIRRFCIIEPHLRTNWFKAAFSWLLVVSQVVWASQEKRDLWRGIWNIPLQRYKHSKIKEEGKKDFPSHKLLQSFKINRKEFPIWTHTSKSLAFMSTIDINIILFVIFHLYNLNISNSSI